MDPRFPAARRIVAGAVAAGAFPAAAVEVGRADGPTWQEAFGTLDGTADSPAASPDTVFDLASLTKVLATATLAARLADEGRLGLDDPLSRWLDAWRGDDRRDVTVRDLLAHCSGLTSHLPFYRDTEGRRDFEVAICNLPLEYAPRTRALYSDLGFMLLAFVLENAGTARLDELFEVVKERLGGPMTFRPPLAWRPRTAPTGVDEWRGRLLVGEVHDSNAWALGGVAGHAGLFGTAPAVGAFARLALRGLRAAAGLVRAPPPDVALATPGVMARFAARTSVPGSSRALGWDTMLPTSSCGTLMRPTAIGHTGFTGSSLWIDWERDLYAVLLTNRVHPRASDERILTVRPAFHDAVVRELTAAGG